MPHGHGERRRENGGLYALKKGGRQVEGTTGRGVPSGGPPRHCPKDREAADRRAAGPTRLEKVRALATTSAELVTSSLAALSFLATAVSATVTQRLTTLSALFISPARSSLLVRAGRRHLRAAVGGGCEAAGLCTQKGPITIRQGPIAGRPISSDWEGGTASGRR